METLKTIKSNNLKEICNKIFQIIKENSSRLDHLIENRIFTKELESTRDNLIRCLVCIKSEYYRESEKLIIIDGCLCFLKDQKIILTLSLKSTENSDESLKRAIRDLDKRFPFGNIVKELNEIHKLLIENENSLQILRRWIELEDEFNKEILNEWKKTSKYYCSILNLPQR